MFVLAKYMGDSTIFDHFPLVKPPRKGQHAAMQFIEEMILDGVQDIVVEAPTGAGKSAIGAALCHWASSWPLVRLDAATLSHAGGYYLVTQKALQEQIVRDVRDNFRNKDFANLKSSEAYPCDTHGNCQVGMAAKKRCCEGKKSKTCPYIMAKDAFGKASLAVTNYPYFLTERLYVGQFPVRNVMVCDECHTIQRQLLKFGELVISKEKLIEWGVRSLEVPEFDELPKFLAWLEKRYLPIVDDRAKAVQLMLESDELASQNTKMQQTLSTLNNQVQRIKQAILDAAARPHKWVYWVDETERDGRVVNLKPLDAAPYMSLIRGSGLARVYMSAYPGEKHIFCRSLGLNPDEVAWIKLKSPFKVENRPIIMGNVGSMSKRNKAQTLPSLLRVVDKVLHAHNDQKGIIHCNSYALGDELFNHFSGTVHGMRLIYPKCADDRDAAIAQHASSPLPSVIISPSMTEGFDFKDDLARWQIVAKMPYPYLGDQQVATLKDQDPAWYAMQTAMSIIQACGRIVRDENDHGVTYILDSDFMLLWDKYRHFFPPWFQAAMVWPGQK